MAHRLAVGAHSDVLGHLCHQTQPAGKHRAQMGTTSAGRHYHCMCHQPTTCQALVQSLAQHICHQVSPRLAACSKPAVCIVHAEHGRYSHCLAPHLHGCSRPTCQGQPHQCLPFGCTQTSWTAAPPGRRFGCCIEQSAVSSSDNENSKAFVSPIQTLLTQESQYAGATVSNLEWPAGLAMAKRQPSIAASNSSSDVRGQPTPGAGRLPGRMHQCLQSPTAPAQVSATAATSLMCWVCLLARC